LELGKENVKRSGRGCKPLENWGEKIFGLKEKARDLVKVVKAMGGDSGKKGWEICSLIGD